MVRVRVRVRVRDLELGLGLVFLVSDLLGEHLGGTHEVVLARPAILASAPSLISEKRNPRRPVE